MPTAEDTLLSFTGPASFGGPHSVRIVTDSGQKGIRGTHFLLSNGDPNTEGTLIVYSYTDTQAKTTPIVADVKLNDICINLNPADPGYLDFYQYREPRASNPGEVNVQWYKEFELTPTSIPYISGRDPGGSLDVVFTDGTAIVPLPPISIPDPLWTQVLYASSSGDPQDMVNLKTQLLANILNIQYNIMGINPTVSNIYPNPPLSPLDSITFDLDNKTGTLSLGISGVEYSSSTWIPLSGEKEIHLIISIDTDV